MLREIAEREGIEVSDEELDEAIAGIIAGVAKPEQMEKVYSADRYMRSVLKNEMYDERLSDHLINIATEGKGAVLHGYDPAVEIAAEPDDQPKKKAGKKAAAEEQTRASIRPNQPPSMRDR